MITSDDDLRLVGIAWRLDRLRWVPTDLLGEIVQAGACMVPGGDPPDDALDDREFAARSCGTCSVQDECLELELRQAGAATVGVWGGLDQDDRRALHPFWLERGDRADRGCC